MLVVTCYVVLFETLLLLARLGTPEALSRPLPPEVSRREWVGGVVVVGTTTFGLSAITEVLDPSGSFAVDADSFDQTTYTDATTGHSSSSSSSSRANTNLPKSKANNNPRPFAPPGALLPAARCKVWIDSAAKVAAPLSSQKTTTNNNKLLTPEEQRDILVELNTILTNRPPLFLDNANNNRQPSLAVAGLTAQITTPVSKANNKELVGGTIVTNSNIGTQIAARLNQADVERQWGILQYEQRQKDAANEVRAALSYYTRQLQFDGNALVLSATSREQRKQMIRNDAIPTVTATITSDLDLRDLYRNQFLTALDDVTAEVVYQIKETTSTGSSGSGSSTGSSSSSSTLLQSVDCSEVIELMDQCTVALNKWFDLIDPKDVQEALTTVRKEAS